MPLLTITDQIPKGLREDLSDLIAVVDAKSKPLLALAKKGAELVNPDVHSWQADGFNAPSFTGVMAGDDVTAWDSPAAQRAKLSGRCQKFRRSIMVDDFAANISDVAGLGRKKEMARGAAKSIEEIGRDIEAAFCSDNDSQAQSAGAPYRTRGLGAWIATAAQADLPVPADYRSVSGAIITTGTDSITEGSIQNILQAIYEQTGTVKNLALLCGPTLKRRFTEFTRTNTGAAGVAMNIKTYNTPASDRKITSTVDVFEGDFGSLQLLPSLHLGMTGDPSVPNARRGYIIDPDMVEVRYGRRPAFRELEDRGGGPRGIIDAIAGLVVHSPRAFGKIASTAA